MQQIQKTARLAGVLYLFSAIAVGVPLIYVPTVLVIPGNPTATANKVLAHEVLFRWCMLGELAGAIAFLFMVRALYRLLFRVNERQASLMVTLVIISLPMTFLNVLSEIASLTLLHGPTFLSVIGQAQRNALAMFFLGLHGDGANLTNIFWGLWLFPFGVLVWRSGFIPRVLGAWLVLNGVALVTVSLTALFLPAELNIVNRLATLPELGELWIMAWLLIVGVKTPIPSSDGIANPADR